MPERSVQGRSLVSRRAIVEIVRGAVLGSYGVTGFADDGSLARLRSILGLAKPGIRVTLGPALAVDLRLTVAYGLPVAEVARQVDSAVRYALRRALGRELDRLTIHVGDLRYEPASVPPSVDAGVAARSGVPAPPGERPPGEAAGDADPTGEPAPGVGRRG